MRNETLRVVIVDDNPVVTGTIRQTLNGGGFEVVGCARDGMTGIDMVCALKPDVVLMDIMMPDTDGLEAARLIRKRCPTPVVILTSYESKELIRKASMVGVAAYLVKPPKRNDLERAIYIAVARFEDMNRIMILNKELEKRNMELEEALACIDTLHGLLPICASCKRIKDDKGYWNRIEEYISSRSQAEFSHGICPDCARKLYPGIMDRIDQK
ncbi:MAG: response regulator [Proteobacteria bacterium]|nr:response regulator [Pseudomonadota bacterium]MBU1686706.1 response regulator [Pseudomonadota bacterium]